MEEEETVAGRVDRSAEIRAGKLDFGLPERCRTLAAALGLHFAGIDLRRTDSGCWFCFEVNPSPGFSFYQEETGQPIAETVARLLAAGRMGGRGPR